MGIFSPYINIFNRQWPAWRAGVIGGSLLGIFLAATVAAFASRSPLWAGGTAFVSALFALALAMATKIWWGFERYTFYHYQLGVLLFAAAWLVLWKQPVLPILDMVALALATALAVGRIGCFMTGCCHGRPHHWGVCYDERHVEAGFSAYLRDVRLFPVQLLESGLMWLIILVGAALAIRHAPDGAVFVWYVCGYGCGRFLLEFLRGDDGRNYHFGFSTPQWTSGAWILMVSILAGVGLLPGGYVPFLAAVVLVLTMILMMILAERLPLTATIRLFQPSHIAEIQQIIGRRQRDEQEETVKVGRTSLGFCLSSGSLPSEEIGRRHYTISRQGAGLDAKTAVRLAQLIIHLQHPDHYAQLISRMPDVFHVIVMPDG